MVRPKEFFSSEETLFHKSQGNVVRREKSTTLPRDTLFSLSPHRHRNNNGCIK
jgi:hypothetical protein